MAVNECDLLFSIGTRFNDRITGKLHSFAPNAQIVHIDIDTAAISKKRTGRCTYRGRCKRGSIKKCWNMYLSVRRRSGLRRSKEWKEEHPLMMKKKPIMTPQDVIETINRIFDEAIIVTDVGQHQMFTAQFYRDHGKEKKTSDVRRSWNYGDMVCRELSVRSW